MKALQPARACAWLMSSPVRAALAAPFANVCALLTWSRTGAPNKASCGAPLARADPNCGHYRGHEQGAVHREHRSRGRTSEPVLGEVYRGSRVSSKLPRYNVGAASKRR